MNFDLRQIHHTPRRRRPTAPLTALLLLCASSLLAATALSAQEAATTTPAPSHPLALPRFESSDAEGFFHINLATGDTYLTTGLDAPPPQTRLLRQNVSREIGLATGMSIGDLLLGPIRGGDGGLDAAILVESATGYVAFFDNVGRDAKFGDLSVAIGRPFEPLANNDRGLSLLMRRDASGRTEGAYLYHATSGRGLYLDGLRKLDPAGTVVATSSWPTLSFRAVSVPLQSSREQTLGYWVADPTSGDSYRVDLSRNTPEQLSARQQSVNLFDAIAGQGPHATYAPLVAVGIEDDNETRHIFMVSVGSGEMAIWYDMMGGNGAAPRLVKLPGNLYDVLGKEPVASPRTLAAVPRIEDDTVTGIFLLDSVTHSVVLVTNLSQPGTVTLNYFGKFGG